MHRIFVDRTFLEQMQELEPYYLWREYYTVEEDEMSPFFGKEYSEFEFSNTIYNYFLTPAMGWLWFSHIVPEGMCMQTISAALPS